MKKTNVMIILFFSSILLSACSTGFLTSTSPINHDADQHMTVLFSDSSNIKKEDSYYDAILELQSENPEQAQPFLIIDSDERDIVRYYDIQVFPTMIVLNGDMEQLRMEGVQSKDEIVTSLKKVLQLPIRHESISFYH
ncbi:thioredoxin family protein [Alkalihalobacillus sp. 1P02AB]|uniref:thioredoxin family protein n=1 Tax=Alkalihalobacillus sp. 1P02AB TaxID=3132260 RepID=UPI0039A74E1F